MQYRALRKEASSRLTLAAAIVMLLATLMRLAVLWYLIASNAAFRESFYSLHEHAVHTADYLFDTRTILLMLLSCAVLGLPVIAMFMIYANARSGKPLKRAGYSIQRAVMLVQAAIYTILFSFCIVLIRSYRTCFTIVSTFETLFLLLVAAYAASALKTAREVVVNGSSVHRYPAFLPIMMIVFFCVLVVKLILLILANTVPALTLSLVEYRMESGTLFCCSIAENITYLASLFLFILLCFRGKNALSQDAEVSKTP